MPQLPFCFRGVCITLYPSASLPGYRGFRLLNQLSHESPMPLPKARSKSHAPASVSAPRLRSYCGGLECLNAFAMKLLQFYFKTFLYCEFHFASTCAANYFFYIWILANLICVSHEYTKINKKRSTWMTILQGQSRPVISKAFCQKLGLVLQLLLQSFLVSLSDVPPLISAACN